MQREMVFNARETCLRQSLVARHHARALQIQFAHTQIGRNGEHALGPAERASRNARVTSVSQRLQAQMDAVEQSRSPPLAPAPATLALTASGEHGVTGLAACLHRPFAELATRAETAVLLSCQLWAGHFAIRGTWKKCCQSRTARGSLSAALTASGMTGSTGEGAAPPAGQAQESELETSRLRRRTVESQRLDLKWTLTNALLSHV
mmetsp:Transcript_74018/g.130778  ORF Transcript_74018/g.130778 Transcript_74018/m.130778 type:complete len:206 (-) Transcript_74018:1361-1978(-)